MGYTVLSTCVLALAGVVVLPLAPVDLAAQDAPQPRISWTGDARLGYFNLHREERSGGETTSDDFRARIRLGAAAHLTPAFSAGLRVAGRFSDSQESISFFVRDHAPGVDGLGAGDVTIDQAYLDYHPSQRWSVRVGRMQTKSTLADLQGKSINRSDSPNVDVTWTDGARIAAALGGGWNSQLIVQHNSADGPTNMARPPLSFTEDRSRFSVFGGVENTSAWGPVVQRGLDVTYIPAALRPLGMADEESEDYLALVARGSLAWPLPVSGSRISVGGELGYAPNTPGRAMMGLSDRGSGNAGGTAYQLAVTLADLVPLHRVGLVYGETEAGWLIAPDFRNNDRLIEARYQWAFSARHSFEARIRQRQDLELPITADRKREDMDFYFRISSRF